MDDLEAVQLFRKAAERYRDAFERKAVRLIDGIFCDLRQVPRQLAQRRVLAAPRLLNLLAISLTFLEKLFPCATFNYRLGSRLHNNR